jgi:hypothetical protein
VRGFLVRPHLRRLPLCDRQAVRLFLGAPLLLV